MTSAPGVSVCASGSIRRALRMISAAMPRRLPLLPAMSYTRRRARGKGVPAAGRLSPGEEVGDGGAQAPAFGSVLGRLGPVAHPGGKGDGLAEDGEQL